MSFCIERSVFDLYHLFINSPDLLWFTHKIHDLMLEKRDHLRENVALKP